MKPTFIAIGVCITFLFSARAEFDFPDFAKLSPAEQQASGYTVTINKGTKPSLIISISPKAAEACKGARLYLRDEKQRELAEISMGLMRSPDGTLSISISLREHLRGAAELIIFSNAPISPNFGGFTFRLSQTQP
jgi:hypothetical protein